MVETGLEQRALTSSLLKTICLYGFFSWKKERKR
jgi:hypothetical protein